MRLSVGVLAAGQGARFGAVKQLANVGDQTLLNRVLAQYAKLDAIEHAVVLGAHAQTIMPTLPVHWRKVASPDWHRGLSQSLRALLACQSEDVTHLLIGLGDQVAVSNQHLQALVAQAERQPGLMVAAHYGDVCGVPAIFPREFWPQLRELEGDQGARKILNGNDNQVVRVDIPAAQTDIDTPADLVSWTARQQSAD